MQSIIFCQSMNVFFINIFELKFINFIYRILERDKINLSNSNKHKYAFKIINYSFIGNINVISIQTETKQ